MEERAGNGADSRSLVSSARSRRSELDWDPADTSPYEVLDIPVSATEADIKKTYRKKSLLIHPDKFKHEQGPEVGAAQAPLTPGIRPAEQGAARAVR